MIRWALRRARALGNRVLDLVEIPAELARLREAERALTSEVNWLAEQGEGKDKEIAGLSARLCGEEIARRSAERQADEQRGRAEAAEQSAEAAQKELAEVRKNLAVIQTPMRVSQ